MRALVLTSYSLRRIARHRALMTALVAFPLLCAAVAAFAGPRVASYCAWISPLAFALLTLGIVLWQKCSDEASGLAAALTCSPLSARSLVVSRLITTAVILVSQLAVFLAIRSI